MDTITGLNFTAIKARTKAVDSIPKVYLTSSINHFVLNSAAVDEMKLKKGEFIMMLHIPGEDEDRRFFLTKAVESDESVAKLGEHGSALHFNYSGIYGAILVNDPKKAIVGNDILEEEGLIQTTVSSAGNNVTRGNTKVIYSLEDMGVHEIENVERQVYALTKRTVKPVIKREASSTNEDVVDDFDMEMDNQDMTNEV